MAFGVPWWRARRLTDVQRPGLKRRQAIEPAIGHTKNDNGMHRCRIKGSEGDALHAVLCRAVRGRLQDPLAAARHRAPGPGAALLLCLRCLAVLARKALPGSTTASDRSTTFDHRLAVTLG